MKYWTYAYIYMDNLMWSCICAVECLCRWTCWNDWFLCIVYRLTLASQLASMVRDFTGVSWVQHSLRCYYCRTSACASMEWYCFTISVHLSVYLSVCQSVMYYYITVSQPHCWLGDRKGIQPVKKLSVGLLVVMIWLELCTIYSSSCHHHLRHPLLQ